jgi:predicted MPP superfamily phosphohydrolase
MRISFILILIGSMFCADVVWWVWAAASLPRTIRHARTWRIALHLFMGIQMACLMIVVFGRFFSERTDEWFGKLLLASVFLWHFILLPIGIWVMLSDFGARGAARLVGLWRAGPQAAETAPAAGLSRRQLLRAAAIATPPVATVLTTGASLWQLSDFRIRKFALFFPQLPQDLDGLTIAQVSDIHVGEFTSGKILNRIVEATNSLHSDLVLLTGDLINHALADLPVGLDIVRKLDSRFGVYMCEGNHDLIESRLGFEEAVKKSSVPLLLNESTMLKIRGRDVQLLGLKWGPSRGDAGIAQSMQTLLPQLQAGAFPILLAHHPHAFDVAAQAGLPLTLSGHTHGGQLMATPSLGFGPMMFRYWSGLYENGESKLIVSNGVGNWFPLRINAPAEIVHITLHKAG